MTVLYGFIFVLWLLIGMMSYIWTVKAVGPPYGGWHTLIHVTTTVIGGFVSYGLYLYIEYKQKGKLVYMKNSEYVKPFK